MPEHLTYIQFQLFIVASIFVLILDYPILRLMKKIGEPLRQVEETLGNSERRIKELKNYPRILGTVERITYVAALVLNKPEFIVIWLGVKTAGGLAPMWSTQKKHIGKVRIMLFQIGSLISIMGAVGSYYLSVFILNS